MNPAADHPPIPLSPQILALGIQLESIGGGEASLSIGYREDLIGDPDTGVMAGGVVTTLLDSACGWATYSLLSSGASLATLDLRIDYMRPSPPGCAIIAQAHCYRLTRLIAFVRAVAHNGDPTDPVAAAQGAFVIDSDAGRQPGVNLQAAAEAGR